MFSDNIKNLCKNLSNINEKMDIICEGGAFLGFYQNGSLQLLKEMEKEKIIQVDRISGVSVGAINAFLYLTDNLSLMDDYFSKIKHELIEEQQIQCLPTILEDTIKQISDEVFESLQNHLFITYYNFDDYKQIVKSTYETRDELLETIYRSCFIPGFMKTCNLVERNDKINFIDGITPHIFQDFRNKKILFLSIAHLDWAKHIIFMRNEHRITARIMSGILDAYDFFHTGKRTKICSYVNNWNLIDYISLHGKEYFGFYIVLLFSLLREIVKKIYPSVSNFSIFKHLEYAFLKMLNAILIYTVQ